MNKPTPTIDTAIRVLNDAFRADPVAIATLLSVRIPCNELLAEHSTIQVQSQWIMGNAFYPTVSALGLINGIVEEMTGQRVAAKYSDLQRSEDLGRNLEGFMVYPTESQNEEKKST
jgi:hypothetical protein